MKEEVAGNTCWVYILCPFVPCQLMKNIFKDNYLTK